MIMCCRYFYWFDTSRFVNLSSNPEWASTGKRNLSSGISAYTNQQCFHSFQHYRLCIIQICTDNYYMEYCNLKAATLSSKFQFNIVMLPYSRE